jgi:UDP-3-O-[3-hydroxymyristoyl] glucosamine N-acyltransferase
MQYRLGDIARRLGLELIGDPSLLIEGISSLVSASNKEISFLSNPRFIKNLADTQAAAVIVKPVYRDQCRSAVLLSENPYLSFAELTALFNNAPKLLAGIATSASIHPDADIHETVSIAANVVIASGVKIGAHTIIEPNCVIAEGSVIGENCHLHANVTLYHQVQLGDWVNIHSGTVIGADGFGFAPANKAGQGWAKIYQLGSVRIGNHVDIGANTCIDRGALEDTIIGNGVIIDNQVQIAHNCIIGENTAIAGCVGIAGSTLIGKNCTLAGGVGVAGHLEITDNVHVTSMSLVTGSILKSGSYSSGTAMMETKAWRKSAVRFSQLEKMLERIKKIEKNAE